MLGKWVFGMIFVVMQCIPFGNVADAQEQAPMVRLSKLVVDPLHLPAYRAALKEEIEASIRLEPGVLTLYAVFEVKNPTHLTILEIYRDRSAYEAHLATPHFQKYKTGTGHMVNSLELIDAEPLIPDLKIK